MATKTDKNSKKKQVTKPNINMVLKKLPNVKINRRKDKFVKILEGNCYLKDVFYGIQVLDNSHGKPGKVIERIQNQKDINQWIKIIKENVKNYVPPNPKSDRVLSPDDSFEILSHDSLKRC